MQILSKIVESNRSAATLPNDKQAAVNHAAVALKLNGQPIEKRKSIESDASPIAKPKLGGHARGQSRKLEPIIDQKSTHKMVPKPSVSPDLIMAAEGQSMATIAAQALQNSTRVNPFGSGPNQPLAASHSIQNTNMAAAGK